MFKFIPHIAEGSWVIKQSVGKTPVIMGSKLGLSYHQTKRYFEVTVDVASSPAASYITGMVRHCWVRGLGFGSYITGMVCHALVRD